MLCENCGGEIRDTAKFCPWCGTKISVAVQVNSPDEKTLTAFADVRENLFYDDEPVSDFEEAVAEVEPFPQNDVYYRISETSSEENYENVPSENYEDIPTKKEENILPENDEPQRENIPPAEIAPTNEDAPSKLDVKFTDENDLMILSELPAAADNDKTSENLLHDREKTIRFPVRMGIAVLSAAIAAGICITAVFIVPDKIIPYVNYRNAQDLFENGDYDAAEEKFSSLGSYEDSFEYVRKCRYGKADVLMEQGNYSGAAEAFASLNGYSDSDELAAECLLKAAEKFKTEGNFDEAISAYYAAGRDDLAEGTAKERAEFFSENGDFFAAAEAAEKFSHDEALRYLYEGSLNAKNSGDLENAAKGFAMLGDHKDSRELLKECEYELCISELEKNGANAENVREFYELGSYMDSEEIFVDAAYGYGTKCFDSGNYYEASLMFRNTGTYKDSVSMLHKSLYELGRSIEESDSISAHSIFAMLGNYSDSAVRKKATKSGASSWYADGYTSVDGFCTSQFRKGDTVIINCTAGTDSPSAPVTILLELETESGFSVSAECENVRNSGSFSGSITLPDTVSGEADIIVSLKDSGEVLRKFDITIKN